jgi:AraC-like DNA-binding protein
VGISPRATIRVMRFRHAVNTALGQRRVHWAQLAADSGYYDQAHLIREFRELAGLTPTALLAERTRAVASVQYGVRDAP